MVKFKNMRLGIEKFKSNGEVLSYKGLHKNGFTFTIILNEYRILVFDIFNERFILDEHYTIGLKNVLNDINSFYNNRKIIMRYF